MMLLGFAEIGFILLTHDHQVRIEELPSRGFSFERPGRSMSQLGTKRTWPEYRPVSISGGEAEIDVP
jgi:hypothetical protein